MKKVLILVLIFTCIITISACRTKIEQNKTPTNVTPSKNMSKQLEKPKKGEKIAIIKTNFGTIKFKLFPNEVPETYKNFETLANEGKYDGVIFHRVIKDFMIQGGDFENQNGTGGYSYKGQGTTIGEEFSDNLKHLRGSVSMAKTNMPHTTGSQFFIVQASSGTPYLNNKHSVFGQVYEGMEVVDKIANLKTGPNDKPLEDAIMEKVIVTDFGSEDDK